MDKNKYFKRFDTVSIAVKTNYGTATINFTVIDVINSEMGYYGLIAQNRIVVGKYNQNDSWNLSESDDLKLIEVNESVSHKNL